MPLDAGTYPVTVPTSNANGGNGNTGLNAGHGQMVVTLQLRILLLEQSPQKAVVEEEVPI